MAIDHHHLRGLINKLESLPPERLAEVEDFIDFLKSRYESQPLTQVAAKTAERSFADVWDNPDDAAYDSLPTTAS